MAVVGVGNLHPHLVSAGLGWIGYHIALLVLVDHLIIALCKFRNIDLGLVACGDSVIRDSDRDRFLLNYQGSGSGCDLVVVQRGSQRVAAGGGHVCVTGDGRRFVFIARCKTGQNDSHIRRAAVINLIQALP